MIMGPRGMEESSSKPLANALALRHGVENARKSPLHARKQAIWCAPHHNRVSGDFHMADLPRLNQVIKAFESGQQAFTTFSPADIEPAVALSQSKFDGVVYEMEHNFWDARMLRDTLQYMLNRRQLVTGGSLAPAVTPMVRIPPNGGEKNQWFAKQALDLGVYGVLWPHISTVDQAYNAVAACRYPRLKSAQRYEPAGIRGDGPTTAARYWGLTQQEYYKK